MMDLLNDYCELGLGSMYGELKMNLPVRKRFQKGHVNDCLDKSSLLEDCI